MAPPSMLLLPLLAALAAAQSLSQYVPACGMPCLTNTISASTTCAADDNVCLCKMMYTLKRNSQTCLQDKCDGAQYGQVMTGLDSFCRDGSSGGSTSSPAPTSEPPAPTGYPTVVSSSSVSSSGATSTEASTATHSTELTSVGTVVPTFVSGILSHSSLAPVPTTAASVGTISQQTSVGTISQQTSVITTQSLSQAPSSTPTQSQISAGVQQHAGYAAVAAGLFVAAFFSL